MHILSNHMYLQDRLREQRQRSRPAVGYGHAGHSRNGLEKVTDRRRSTRTRRCQDCMLIQIMKGLVIFWLSPMHLDTFDSELAMCKAYHEGEKLGTTKIYLRCMLIGEMPEATLVLRKAPSEKTCIPQQQKLASRAVQHESWRPRQPQAVRSIFAIAQQLLFLQIWCFPREFAKVRQTGVRISVVDGGGHVTV